MDAVLACFTALNRGVFSATLASRPAPLFNDPVCPSVCATDGDTRAAPATTYQDGAAGHPCGAYRPHLQRTAPVVQVYVRLPCAYARASAIGEGCNISHASISSPTIEDYVGTRPGRCFLRRSAPSSRVPTTLRIFAGDQGKSAAAQGCSPPAMIADGRRTVTPDLLCGQRRQPSTGTPR